MPRIPTDMLNSVVYLYPNVDAAEEGRGFGGTGFIIDMSPDGESPSSTPLRFRYVVTNRHIVDGARGEPAHVVRANTADGGTVCITTEPEGWIFNPRHDVAIHRLTDPDVPFRQYGRIRLE